MSLPAKRLALCVLLFASWLGYLGYLVFTRPLTESGRPLVLSRPQIQASELDVIAELPAPQSKEPATVLRVLHSPGGVDLKPEDQIRVTNLADCHPPTGQGTPMPDWAGQGRYLLPLRRVPRKPGYFEVVPIPASPGFTAANVCRIYPATAEAIAQYDRIGKAGADGGE